MGINAALLVEGKVTVEGEVAAIGVAVAEKVSAGLSWKVLVTRAVSVMVSPSKSSGKPSLSWSEPQSEPSAQMLRRLSVSAVSMTLINSPVDNCTAGSGLLPL